MDKLQKILLISLLGTSVISWIVSTRDQQPAMMNAMMTYNPTSISLFTASWTAGMAAMMFPAIAPMVLLYSRLIRGDRSRSSGETLVIGKKEEEQNKSNTLNLILFVGSYLVVWALTGIALLLAWSFPMNNFFIIGGIRVKQHDLDVLSGVLLVLSGSYQFTSLKTRCLGYCQSPMSFFMRRWKGGVSGAVKMGTYHGLYCLGCCWPYFLLMVALGWMSLLWMALFAGIIFAEKVWSRRGGLWIARIAGIGFVVVGLLNIFGIITLQNTVANTFNSSSGSAMLPPDNGNGIHSDMHNMQMGINHNHH